MKNLFQCDFCYARFIDEDDCKKHEVFYCRENTLLKWCDTCRFMDQIMGATGKVYFKCSKNVLLDHESLSGRKNCSEWEIYCDDDD